MTAIRRWKRLAVLSAALVLLVPAATAGTREDYARQWPLTLGQEDSGAYRVALDASVYRSASLPSLGDIEVFNAEGQPLPAAVLSPAQPLAQSPRLLALPWFALPATDPAAGGGDLRLVVERDGDGGVVRIEAGIDAPVAAPRAPGQWLVDASRLREPVRALVLNWQPPSQSLQVRYRVEGSNDLRQWRTLNEGTTLLDLERGGERLRQGRIVLDGQARYLRLLPLRPGLVPALTAVTAELAPPPPETRWEWQEITGERRSEGGRTYFDFTLPGRFPVERADVRLPGNSAVEWTLHSREADGAWLWRAGPWMAFQVGGGGSGTTSQSEPKPLASVVRDRHWRLTANSPVGDAVPTLRLGYRPEVVVFLAQGSPPYALAAGSVQGILFGYVLSSQQIFTEIYGLGHYFPVAFAAIAIGIAVAGFINSRIVGRYGMRVISHGALIGQLVVAIAMLAAAATGSLPLWLMMVLATASLFTFGLMFSNFSALAMEPQGHIAGTASSLFGSITTLIGIAVGSAIGQYYNGTLIPLATGALLSSVFALAVVFIVEKGRLFVPHNKPI